MKDLLKSKRIVTFLVTVALVISCMEQLKSQVPPVQSTWFATDGYGRKYDTKLTKERYYVNENGEIDGTYILYYEDGKTVKQRIKYQNGKKNGPADLGYATGYYKNDLEEGEWVENYFGDNITVINYVQGEIVGKKITYSDKSRTKILSSTEYQNGVPNGMHISYFEDGKIKEEGNYVNGKKNGYWIEYMPDLVTSEFITSKGSYINGNKDGEWINYGECYANLSMYGLKYSYEPKKTENSYIEYYGESDKALGPKKGYNAVYDNGKYEKDYKVLTPEEKKKIEELNKTYQEQLKKLERERMERKRIQDSIEMAKQQKIEKEENDYRQMIDGIKSKPFTDVERDFAGSWEFKSEKIYTNDAIIIFFEEFNVLPDRTYTYKAYFKKWLEPQIYREYNEKGIWEIKDNTFYAYINEENGKPSKRIDPLVFDKITAKKAIRTINDNGMSVVVRGKKVAGP